MSFWNHPFYTPAHETSFTPLFRLLDDFDNYSRQATPSDRQGRRALRQFNPKFDVRETENTFELHGELPGLTKENIQVDFTDPQTIVIKGKVERSYEEGTHPSTWESAGAIEAPEEQKKLTHSATVEDAPEEGESSKPAEGEQQVEKAKKTEAPKHRYWVSERSSGSFHRTFSFPCNVDQDKVSASLKDGILHITVPKAQQPTTRRITVS